MPHWLLPVSSPFSLFYKNQITTLSSATLSLSLSSSSTFHQSFDGLQQWRPPIPLLGLSPASSHSSLSSSSFSRHSLTRTLRPLLPLPLPQATVSRSNLLSISGLFFFSRSSFFFCLLCRMMKKNNVGLSIRDFRSSTSDYLHCILKFGWFVGRFSDLEVIC